ncbi:MAG TPA: hypothetical protein VI547_08720 [Anaerolineales bacterium]|nr:hypothetical protein [Anaerolineales bacterium]HLF02047.1 hypothetical protein [Anaerolineales bacterium]
MAISIRASVGGLAVGLLLALSLGACAAPSVSSPSAPKIVTPTLPRLSPTPVWETPAPPTLSAAEVLAAKLKRLGFNIRGWT